MSIHWMNRVWELSRQKGSYLLGMLAIADNANDYGVAWPGYNTLAAKTRLSARTAQRMVEHLSEEQELAIHTGGGGRRDTNLYVILLGRTSEEIDAIVKELKNKYVNLTSIKGGQFVYLDKLSTKKIAKKVDTAVSSDPSITMVKGMDGWMDGDPICDFLRALPGYNSANLKTDRAAIDPHAQAYDLEALKYLWSDCEAEAQENPIGLFLFRSSRGMQSPRFVDLCLRRRENADRLNRPSPAIVRPDVPLSEPIETDPSVIAFIPGHDRMTPIQVWQAAQGELQLQMTRASYDTWVKPTTLLSVNGTWKIGVPNQYSKEWWDNRLMTTVKRILSGIVGQECTPEFIVIERGEA